MRLINNVHSLSFRCVCVGRGGGIHQQTITPNNIKSLVSMGRLKRRKGEIETSSYIPIRPDVPKMVMLKYYL